MLWREKHTFDIKAVGQPQLTRKLNVPVKSTEGRRKTGTDVWSGARLTTRTVSLRLTFFSFPALALLYLQSLYLIFLILMMEQSRTISWHCGEVNTVNNCSISSEGFYRTLRLRRPVSADFSVFAVSLVHQL